MSETKNGFYWVQLNGEITVAEIKDGATHVVGSDLDWPQVDILERIEEGWILVNDDLCEILDSGDYLVYRKGRSKIEVLTWNSKQRVWVEGFGRGITWFEIVEPPLFLLNANHFLEIAKRLEKC